MGKANFWEIVFYSALGVFLLWSLLKLFGIIHSPEWLSIGLPALSGGVAIGSFYQKFKQMEKDLRNISDKTSRIYEACPKIKGRHVA